MRKSVCDKVNLYFNVFWLSMKLMEKNFKRPSLEVYRDRSG